MLLNTLDTTVTIQRGQKFGYALPTKTDYEETQKLRIYNVNDCPNHADNDTILKRIDEFKSIIKLFSETDDGLSRLLEFSGTHLAIRSRIQITGFARYRTLERENR